MDDHPRAEGKRDRLARFYRVLSVLQAHGEQGVRVEEIARRVGTSKRTTYRDLVALEGELGIPVWSDGHGTWGVEGEGFLPPLKLTLDEAMAVVVAARLMTRYADTYDPDLAAAFQKLEDGLPAPLRDHVERTLATLAARPTDEAHARHVHQLTRAWAERRTVTFRYRPARYEERGPRAPEARQARVRPYLLEPSVQTHALYLLGWDETRGALRTFKVERIEDLALTGETFDDPPTDELAAQLGRAWDIIADQPPTEVVLRFAPPVAARVAETIWHPSQRQETADDGSLVWRATVAGRIEIKLWILSWGADVEVLEPPELRADVAATLARAAAIYPR
ncbi:MAG TPA: WYL domain-containing protein [Candidatus Limnocylindrales bacterium]|nr:WYL domain-containing protein [Candidatus Limnocylindrales bacterium]